MKFTRNKMLVGLFVILVIGAAALSQTVVKSGRIWGHGCGPGGHMLAFFTKYLDLTDAQQAQVKQILQKDQPTMQPLVEDLKQGRQQLRQLEEEDAFDEGKVRALVAQHSQNLTELIVQKARIESEMLQVLSPEQKAKFKQFMDRRAERFHGWMSQAAPQS